MGLILLLVVLILVFGGGGVYYGPPYHYYGVAPLSSPHRTYAAQALCEMLDQTATIFPGSRLRLRFALRPPPRLGLAFPGSPTGRATATADPPTP
jgi:hypothetical protein